MRSHWDEDLAILSAENVSFSVQTAGLGSRLAAVSIDMTIQLILLTVVLLAIDGFNSYVTSIDQMPALVHSILTGLLFIFIFLLFFGYFFFFEATWDGQTPGKRYLGLRVSMANGLPLTVWPALTRNVLRIVDFLPFSYGVGAIVAILNPLNQRAGDLAAGTIVTRETRREKERKSLTINEAVDLFLNAATGTLPDKNSGPITEDEALELRASRRIDPEAAALALKINRQDYENARGFLDRRDTLPPETRRRLGRNLVASISARLKEDPGDRGEAWLEEVVAVLTRAYGQ